MGEFLLSVDGANWHHVPNIMHDEGAESILRALFPPYGSIPSQYTLRAHGGWASYPIERPNPGGGFINKDDGFNDIVANRTWNPDGTAYSEVHSLIQLTGVPLTWTSLDYAGMGDLASSVAEFENSIAWSGTPQSWYRDVIDPPIPSKPLWAKKEWEAAQGAPWIEPRWHQDYLCGVQGCATSFEIAMVFEPWRAASFPIGALVIEGFPVPNERLFFSARMKEPFRLAMGQKLFVRYRCLIKPRYPNSPHTITPAFSKVISDLIGGFNPDIQGYQIALSTSALSRFDTIATMDELNPLVSVGYDRQDLDPWDATGPSASTFVWSPFENVSPDPWEPIRTVAIVANVGGADILAWSMILDQAYTLQPGESIRFDDDIVLNLVSE